MEDLPETFLEEFPEGYQDSHLHLSLRNSWDWQYYWKVYAKTLSQLENEKSKALQNRISAHQAAAGECEPRFRWHIKRLKEYDAAACFLVEHGQEQLSYQASFEAFAKNPGDRFEVRLQQIKLLKIIQTQKKLIRALEKLAEKEKTVGLVSQLDFMKKTHQQIITNYQENRWKVFFFQYNPLDYLEDKDTEYNFSSLKFQFQQSLDKLKKLDKFELPNDNNQYLSIITEDGDETKKIENTPQEVTIGIRPNSSAKVKTIYNFFRAGNTSAADKTVCGQTVSPKASPTKPPTSGFTPKGN